MQNENAICGSGVLKLQKPIDIDGSKVSEIKYDFDEMTARDKINATNEMRKEGCAPTVEEIDGSYHLFLFIEAAKKASPSLEPADILRMSAKDTVKAGALARDFFYIDSEDISPTNI